MSKLPGPRPADRALGGARHPAHYLSIPPSMFGMVVEQLAKSGCTEGARFIVENHNVAVVAR